MEQYLKCMRVRMKDYGEFVQQVSRRVKEASLSEAAEKIPDKNRMRNKSK